MRNIFIKLLILFSGIIIGIIIGILAKPISHDKLLTSDNNNTFEAGWEAAKSRLIETGYLQDVDSAFEVKRTNAVITRIDGNKLYIKVPPVSPLSPPELDNRIANIDKNTEVFIKVKKDSAIYQQELEEFKLENPELAIGSEIELIGPSEYTQKKVSTSELSPNQAIIIESDIDFKDKKEFNAKSIKIK